MIFLFQKCGLSAQLWLSILAGLFLDLTSFSGTSLLNPTSCSVTTFVTSCGLTSLVFATSYSVISCNVYLLCILSSNVTSP
jgi:hypothetical protein